MADKKFIIEVRTKGFAKANRDMGKLDTSSKSYEKTTGRMRGKTQGFMRSIGSLRNSILLYTFALGAAAKTTSVFVQSASKFQDVKVRLVGLMGGVLDAERAFQKFNAVAAKTPFTLDDVVNAGAQLKAFGADAEALLGPITDLAAYMGTTATEAANAFGRAYAGGAGEADIFRTKGVLNIIRDFKGIEDLTNLTLPQFRRAMEETFTDPSTGIAGSTERLAKTFTGAMSNMGDSMTRLAAEIGDIFLPALTASAIEMGAMADSMREWIQFAREGRETINLFGDGLDVFGAKLRGMKDIDELTRMMKEMEEQMGVNKKDMAEMGDIASIKFIPPKAVDNLRTFTLLLGDEEINLDNIQKGLTLIPGQMKDWTGATEAHVATQDTMNVGSETYIAKLELMKQRIAELRAEEIKRNDILSDINMEEVLRQERIDALIILEKMEADEIARANQLMDDQIARMENAATASAGMRDGMKAQINVAGALSSALQTAFDPDLGDGEAFKGFVLQLMSAMQGVILASDAMNKALTFAFVPGLGQTAAIAALIGLEVAKASVRSIKFAETGFEGVVNKPTMFMTGEGNKAEHVSITPLQSPNISGPQSGGINITINGGLIDDSYVRNELIPALNKATSLGTRLHA